MPLRRLKDFRPVRSFALKLGLVISLIVAGIFIGIYIRTDSLLLKAVRYEAESYFNLIVHTRQWNANTGGVSSRKGVAWKPTHT